MMYCGITNNIFNQQLHGLTACLEVGRKGKDGSNYQMVVKKKSSEAEIFATMARISAPGHPRQVLPSLTGGSTTKPGTDVKFPLTLMILYLHSSCIKSGRIDEYKSH